MEAKIDPKDTNLKNLYTTQKTKTAPKQVIGVRTKKTPNAVATPLPPLNPKKGENICPNTAQTPQNN